MSSAPRYHHTLYNTAVGTEDQELDRRRAVPLYDPERETEVGSVGVEGVEILIKDRFVHAWFDNINSFFEYKFPVL